jgi:hypothetical protein
VSDVKRQANNDGGETDSDLPNTQLLFRWHILENPPIKDSNWRKCNKVHREPREERRG